MLLENILRKKEKPHKKWGLKKKLISSSTRKAQNNQEEIDKIHI